MHEPIFIVGMPRSGSTAFYNTLARHPDLAFITQTTKKFPRSLWLTRLMMLLRRDRRPTEGHRIWRRTVRPENDILGPEDVSEGDRRYYRELVDMHGRLAGKSRFLSKHPRNVLRMRYLREIFPDALFLHLIRDGRAVARSVLEMRESHGGREVYWGLRVPGWQELERLDPVESVARQWSTTIEHARGVSAALPGRYVEIRYEDFCTRPIDTLRLVGDWAGLAWPDDLVERATADVESRNYKWAEAFSSQDVQTLERVMGPLLDDLGYPWKNRIERSAKSNSGAQ